MNILALDLASRTGWAILRDGHIISGVEDFTKRRGDSNGMVFLRLLGWLDANFYNTQVVYYELAHMRGAGTALLMGMTSHLESWATRNGVEYTAVHTGTLKKATVGHGNATKPEMMAWFQEQVGYEPLDDNEADAYALLRFGMRELGQKQSGDKNGAEPPQLFYTAPHMRPQHTGLLTMGFEVEHGTE